MPPIAVAVVAFGSDATVERCLASIAAQTHPVHRVIVVDNPHPSGAAGPAVARQERFAAGIRLVRNPVNVGYAAAQNQAFEEARAAGAAWLLFVNPDAHLDPDYLARALAGADAAGGARAGIGAVQGRVLWSGDPRRLDAAGIEMRRNRRNFVLGQGLPDGAPAFARRGEIFGADGAVALYALAMLEDVAIDGEPFDADFFAYRDEVDLAWRARARGWRAIYVPDAVAYHARTYSPRTRPQTRARAPHLRRLSLRNRYLLLLKNESMRDLLRDLPFIAAFDLGYLGYLALFDRPTLGGLAEAVRLAPRMWRKRRQFRARPVPAPRCLRPWIGIRAPVPGVPEPPVAPALPRAAPSPEAGAGHEAAAVAPAFSVVVPARNAERTIGACLRALGRQSGAPAAGEIIVVDDGSTDGTARLAEAAGARLVRLAVNRGPAAARNHGVRTARGDVVVFTDADCEPAPDFVARMLAPFAAPDVIAAKGVYAGRPAGLVARFAQLEHEDRYRRTARVFARLGTIDFVDTHAAAYRRQALLAAGGFDEALRVGEDQELSFRMAAAGGRLVFVPTARVAHLGYPATIGAYARRKFAVGYWKTAVLRRHPARMLGDSNTPRVLALQVALVPVPPLFLLTAVPFALRALRRDAAVAAIAPALLYVRAAALGAGLVAGLAAGAWRR